GPARIELDTATQDLDRLIDHFEAVVNSPEIDVRPSPQRIQARNLPKMMGRALQIVEQETNGCQAVMHVRSVRFQPQRVAIILPSLLVVALRNGLACLLAQTLNSFVDHEPRPQLMAVGGTTADPRLSSQLHDYIR